MKDGRVLGVWQDPNTLRALQAAFAVIEFSPDGIILDINAVFERMTGYRRDELVGRHHRIFVRPDEAASDDYVAFWDRLRAGSINTGEFHRLTKGGRAVWVQASYMPVTDDHGNVIRVVKLALDNTASRQRAEDEHNLLAAIDRSQAIAEFSPDGFIRDANDNFLAATGYTLDEIRDRKHSMLVTDAYAASEEYAHFWRRMRAGEFFVGEYLRVGKGGRELWLQASYNPVFDGDGKVVKIVKFATDLRERMRNVALLADGLSALTRGDLDVRIAGTLIPSLDKLRIDFNRTAEALRAARQAIDRAQRERDELEVLANHDPLTGLPSLRALRSWLAVVQARREHVGVIFIDLDDFKQVNDRYGHQAGDAVLIETARRIRRAIRSFDIVARRSGDEFVVLVNAIRNRSEMLDVATRIRHALSPAIDVRGVSINVQASFGDAVFDDRGETAEELIERADRAMYRDKEGKKKSMPERGPDGSDPAAPA